MRIELMNRGIILILFSLLQLFLCPSLYAQQNLTQQSDALKIAELEKSVKELQNQNIELERKYIEAKTQLIMTDVDHLKRELKEDVTWWIGGLIGLIGLFAALGGTGLIVLYVKNQVADKIAGEKTRFDNALSDMETARQEITSTKNELTKLHQNFIHLLLAGSMPNDDLAKNLPPETVLDIFKEAKTERFVRSAALEVFRYHRYNPAIPFITESFDHEDNSAHQIISTLTAIGSPEACNGLIGFCNSLSELPYPQRKTKVLPMIMTGLGTMKRPEATPVLKKAVLQLDLIYQDELQSATSAIVNIEGDNAQEALKDILEQTDKIQVKINCLQALEKLIGASDVVPYLIKFLNDEGKEVRVYAAWALGRIGEPAKESISELIKRLSDEEGDVRVNAINALTEMGDLAVPQLTDALSCEDKVIRREAATILSKIGTDAKSATPALMNLLNDDDWVVRRNAARALGAIGAEPAVSAFIQALKDRDERVCESAAVALRGIGTPEAMKALKEKKP